MNELELEEMNRGVIADFRANGGKVGGQHASLDIILLHHLGARSGQARVTPLACVRDGEDKRGRSGDNCHERGESARHRIGPP